MKRTARPLQQSCLLVDNMSGSVHEGNSWDCRALSHWQRVHGAAGIGGISADERLAIERSQGGSRGIASAVVAVSEPVLASATAVAALSCEALRAQVPFLSSVRISFCLPFAENSGQHHLPVSW